MLSEYLINCKYRVGTLKPFIYLIPSSSTINYTVDNGEAIVMSVNGSVNKLKCANVQLTSEESMDGRFKFNNKVIIKLFENQTSGLIEILNNLIKEKCQATFVPKYYIIKESLPYTETNKKLNFKLLESEDILDSSNYNIQGNIIKPIQKVKIKRN